MIYWRHQISVKELKSCLKSNFKNNKKLIFNYFRYAIKHYDKSIHVQFQRYILKKLCPN